MSWLPFYREVMQVLATYENRQSDLLALLREMQSAGLNTIALNDENENGESIPLEEIDPFTFLATFHRTGEEMRRKLWSFLRDRWQLSQAVPESLDGLPTINAQKSWCFAYKKERQPEDVPTLWQIFQLAARGENIPNELWTRALAVKGVGLAKLTIGLFWANAERYLTLDATMLKYLARFGVKPPLQKVAADFAEYSQVLASAHDALGFDHLQISSDAWQTRDTATGVTRYWAGGHDWAGNSQLERFKSENIWQNGFQRDDPKGATSWQLFDEIQIGDEFAIKGCGADNLKVHALGRVTDIEAENGLLHLDFLAERPLYQGKRPVGAGAGNWTQTLLEVKRPEDIALIFHGEKSAPLKIENEEPLPSFPHNQILFGPPGTGKTYSSIARAVEIIDGAEMSTREETVARFEELRAEKRIGFVTFHQSFAYEEFVEGLRPVMDDESDGAARYEIRDGAFKEIALRALTATLRFPAKPTASPFDALWDELTRQIDEVDNYQIPGLGSARFRLSLSSGNSIYGENVNGYAKKPYIASRKKVREVWEQLDPDEKPTHNRIHSILERGAHTTIISAVIQELREIAGKDAPMSTQHIDGKSSFDEIWDIFVSRFDDPEATLRWQKSEAFTFKVTFDDDELVGTNIRNKDILRTNKAELHTLFECVPLSYDKYKEVQEYVPSELLETFRRNSQLMIAALCELRRIENNFYQLPLYEHKDTPLSTPSTVEKRPTLENAREWLDGAHGLEKVEDEAPRFVLIIDEINRGNIARIFGELITLLESDKRLGAANALRVTLPYSRDTFGVPRNLYLLGTMNTADKSLALLDVALRRRFRFEELRPNFVLCDKMNPRMRRVLETLNARLMRILDREHRLGHAQWISVSTPAEWNSIFQFHIVPLLQEYFYNDWDSLRAVLGEKNKGSIVRELKPLDGLKQRTRYVWWFDDDDATGTPDFLNVLAENFNLQNPDASASTQPASTLDASTLDAENLESESTEDES